MSGMGNLDNLSLGMGLKASQSQLIPAVNAGLDGWSPLSAQEKAKKTSLGIFGALLLLFFLYKVMR